MSTVFAQTRNGLANATPFILGMLLALVPVLPYGAPELSYVMPSLTLMTVYYWAYQRPDLMPSSAVFIIGLWQDVLYGGPMGLTSLILVLVRELLVNQRRVLIGKPFMVTWMGFAMVVAGTLMLSWGLASWWHWSLIAVPPFVAHLALTITLYPIFAGLFAGLQRWLFEED